MMGIARQVECNCKVWEINHSLYASSLIEVAGFNGASVCVGFCVSV